ncbi:helix-turn-helix domain-containing protein [Streptomyces sp. So13.3]|uniref:helix-turn-helix domain-containing protein n=1 Tax=Streptomyces sp. So13.3 TaxID=2136173 RepID=UPI001106C828|nr:helix-turn-helix domain-containing protein [Streptomyces sp. So13.3]QNA73427.1 helix-turn-helix domain-containing protein [Streptomyces sp. So13.3]
MVTMDRLLSVEEAAEALNTKPRFVRRLIEERRIEYIKVGTHVRIRESVIAAYLLENTVAPVVRRLRAVA